MKIHEKTRKKYALVKAGTEFFWGSFLKNPKIFLVQYCFKELFDKTMKKSKKKSVSLNSPFFLVLLGGYVFLFHISKSQNVDICTRFWPNLIFKISEIYSIFENHQQRVICRISPDWNPTATFSISGVQDART